MKTNYLLKISYIFFILLGMHAAYADKIEFTFLYGSGIESMDYVNASDALSSQINSTMSPTSSQLTVDFSGNFKALSWEADNFNTNYGPTNKMGLNTANTIADATDIYTTGTLIINGNQILGNDFALAHEHKSKDWWIATNDGSRSSSISTQFNLKDTDGNNYCLNQNGKNYQVVVTKGECNYQPYQFTFQPGKHVYSVEFIPLESPESGQVGSIESSEVNGNTIITINAAPLNSPEIANGFNSLMPADIRTENGCNSRSGGGVGVYNFELHVQGLVCGPAPEDLDFYVAGYLKINGNFSMDWSSNNRVFILAHGENRWWLGTLNDAFDRYGGGGATYNNHAEVQIIDSEGSFIGYNLEAVSDSSFKVNSAV